jgi:uncharacterized surface protein with fasciclin (FAS1) repeats
MKTLKYLFFGIACLTLIMSCKTEKKETTTNEAQTESESTERTGQAFIEDDGSTTVLSIAIGSKDHSTLVAAVQAAQLENALVLSYLCLKIFAVTKLQFRSF